MDSKWQARSIKSAPLLADLRDRVFKHSEKRSPKWKFRLAPDLVVQIQPKLTTALLKFECRALQCANADAAKLLRQEKQIEDWWRLNFDLAATVPDEWQIKPTGYGWKGGADQASAYHLPNRVIDAFERGHFDRLRPEIMLGQNCMICGKGLTDPVSMARFIGPECAGTASPSLPFTIDLNAVEAA